LEIDAATQGGAVKLTLSGELDLGTAPRLHAAVEAALRDSPPRLIVDLRPLGFLDSSGLRLFIELAQRAEREGWQLSILRPPEPTLSIFRITRAEENLPFVEPQELE
jgi:anti-anti-sigma factor